MNISTLKKPLLIIGIIIASTSTFFLFKNSNNPAKTTDFNLIQEQDRAEEEFLPNQNQSVSDSDLANNPFYIPDALTPVSILQPNGNIWGEGSVFMNYDSVPMLVTAHHNFDKKYPMQMRVIFRNKVWYVCEYQRNVRRDGTLAVLCPDPVTMYGDYNAIEYDYHEKSNFKTVKDTIELFDMVTGKVFKTNVLSKSDPRENSVTNYIVISDRDNTYKKGNSGRLFFSKNAGYFVFCSASTMVQKGKAGVHIGYLCPISITL